MYIPVINPIDIFPEPFGPRIKLCVSFLKLRFKFSKIESSELSYLKSKFNLDYFIFKS